MQFQYSGEWNKVQTLSTEITYAWYPNVELSSREAQRVVMALENQGGYFHQRPYVTHRIVGNEFKDIAKRIDDLLNKDGSGDLVVLPKSEYLSLTAAHAKLRDIESAKPKDNPPTKVTKNKK